MRLLLLLFFTSFCSLSFCQGEGFTSTPVSKNITITGTLKKSNNDPYPYVSILVIRSRDSSVIKGTTTDKNGLFTVAIPQADKEIYRLYASELRSQKFISQLDLSYIIPDSIINLGVIRVNENIKTLEEIIVRGKKPLLVRKLDRLEFDVANSVLSKGYNALEVLSKLPGITVDVSGNVLVNGKGDIFLLIDGKGQFMQKEQAQMLLGGLRAENIERVEIISNPSAKYDAQGSAVINIITKRDKMKSDVHSTYGNQLYPVKDINGFDYRFFNAGTNLSYEIGKVKTSFGVDFSTSREYRNSTRETLIILSKNLKRSNTNLDIYREIGLSYRAGFNFDINKRNSFDVTFNSFGAPQKQYSSVNSNIYQTIGGSENPDSAYTMVGTQTFDKGRFNALSAKYLWKIDESGGKNLYVFFEYSGVTNPGTQSFNGLYSFNTGPDKYDTFFFDRKYKVNIYSAHADYEQPLKKNSFLETGIKITKIYNNDNASLRYMFYDGFPKVVKSSENRFKYNETITGFYLNLRRNFKKIKAQIGLRGEATESEGKAFLPDRVLKRSYFNLFPSAAVQYTYNDNNQLGLNYSMRIVRPGYTDFNPNNTYATILTNIYGNPSLTPQIQNNLEFSYLYKSYYLSIGFNHASRPRVDLPQTNQDSGITIIRYITNLRYTTNSRINLSLPFKLTSWWQTYSNIGVTNTITGLLNNEKQSNWFINLNSYQNFSINAANKIELNFFYSSGSRFAYTRTQALANLSLGYKYTIKKGKLEAGFNINDVLGINKFRMVSDYGYQFYEMKSVKNNRFFRVSISYLFTTGNKFSLRSNSSKADFGEKRY